MGLQGCLQRKSSGRRKHKYLWRNQVWTPGHPGGGGGWVVVVVIVDSDSREVIRSMQKVKVRVQRSSSQRSKPNLNVSGL